jgi:toxin-antitoxin system PIN domain toxin
VSYTLDANLLLYASDESSPYHERSRELIAQAAHGPEIVYLFWPTIMAYLRIATHPAVFRQPLSTTEAIGNMDALIGRPHVQTPGEQESFWTRFVAVASDARPAGNTVPDTQIVSLMLIHGVKTIWTHDRDFRRFRGIEVHDPFD